VGATIADGPTNVGGIFSKSSMAAGLISLLDDVKQLLS
jgi:hypothetical protein